jgi:hypothetical protein
MNLVQITERLKDLPEQVIRQYSNGMNPEIPAYVALGELQRRERVAQQMATAQGAQQGPQPSIKEQIEQRAGLMAAQGLQQQQMMQQMAQQRAPGPVPAGMPQPEDQPEAQATMTAARGGLARAPVNFNFQTGGIVAFDEGGETDKYETPYDRMNRKNRGEMTKEERQKQDALEALIAQIPRDTNTVQGGERVSGNELSRNVSNTAMALPGASAARALSGSAGSGRGVIAGLAALTGNDQVAPSAAPSARPAAPPVSDRRLLNQADAALRSAPATPAAPIADLKALAEQKQRQQAPRPAPAAVAPAAPAAPAQPDPNSMDAMFRAQLGKAPKERTVEEIQAEQRAIREGAGLTGPAGAAQLERIRKLQEQYEGSKPTPFQDLIRVLGQSAQYKGMSGMAPAYTANLDQKRAADLAMAQKINEMMSGVETTQRGEMKDIASGTSTARATDRASGVEFTKNLLSTLNTARGNDLTAASNEAQRRTLERGQDLNYKAAMAQVAATAARNNMELTANQRAAIADKALDNVNATLKANMKLNIEVGKNPALMQQLLKAETDRLMAAAGGTTMPAAPGAASPGGTTRMRFDAQGNPIK